MSKLINHIILFCSHDNTGYLVKFDTVQIKFKIILWFGSKKVCIKIIISPTPGTKSIHLTLSVVTYS